MCRLEAIFVCLNNWFEKVSVISKSRKVYLWISLRQSVVSEWAIIIYTCWNTYYSLQSEHDNIFHVKPLGIQFVKFFPFFSSAHLILWNEHWLINWNDNIKTGFIKRLQTIRSDLQQAIICHNSLGIRANAPHFRLGCFSRFFRFSLFVIRFLWIWWLSANLGALNPPVKLDFC